MGYYKRGMLTNTDGSTNIISEPKHVYLCAFFCFCTYSSCQVASKNQPDTRVRYGTEAALIYENGLAYDGCSERIELLADSSVYVPTANTLPILQKALADLPRSSNGQSRAVTIRFIETGQQGTLACGWGAQSKVSEMDVLDITKR